MSEYPPPKVVDDEAEELVEEVDDEVKNQSGNTGSAVGYPDEDYDEFSIPKISVYPSGTGFRPKTPPTNDDSKGPDDEGNTDPYNPDKLFRCFAALNQEKDMSKKGWIDTKALATALMESPDLKKRLCSAADMREDSDEMHLARAIIAAADVNGDGLLQVEEFENLIRGWSSESWIPYDKMTDAQRDRQRQLKGAAVRAEHHRRDSGGFAGLDAEEAKRVYLEVSKVKRATLVRNVYSESLPDRPASRYQISNKDGKVLLGGFTSGPVDLADLKAGMYTLTIIDDESAKMPTVRINAAGEMEEVKEEDDSRSACKEYEDYLKAQYQGLTPDEARKVVEEVKYGGEVVKVEMEKPKARMGNSLLRRLMAKSPRKAPKDAEEEEESET